MTAPDYRVQRMEGGGEGWLRRILNARIRQSIVIGILSPQDSAEQGLEILLGGPFSITLSGKTASTTTYGVQHQRASVPTG